MKFHDGNDLDYRTVYQSIDPELAVGSMICKLNKSHYRNLKKWKVILLSFKSFVYIIFALFLCVSIEMEQACVINWWNFEYTSIR